jgi:hypothetical protein
VTCLQEHFDWASGACLASWRPNVCLHALLPGGRGPILLTNCMRLEMGCVLLSVPQL